MTLNVKLKPLVGGRKSLVVRVIATEPYHLKLIHSGKEHRHVAQRRKTGL